VLSRAAELYEPLMDRKKPLWEFWVFEGLEDGRIALLQKTHHAAVDGMSSMKAAELLFDFTPEPRSVAPAPADFWDAPRHGQLELLLASYRNLGRYWWDGVARGPERVRSLSIAASRYLAGVREPLTGDAPKTRLNASVDPRRSFAEVRMSLSQVKTIARSAGVKLNDVVLAICGEGLSRYLSSHGDVPRRSLIASCPVSLHKPGDASIGNQVSAMNVSLATDVADLKQRLTAIHDSANNAKAAIGDVRGALSMDFGGFGLPAILQQAARLGGNGLLADGMLSAPMNLVVSNVPGFQVPLYVAGARLISQMPMSIVAHGAAVNLTVTSYLDRLDLGITAARRRVPDVDRLAAHLRQAYLDLLDRFEPEQIDFEELAVAAA
jgi:WS/DGAT/MGAT family acyltransferase